MRGRLIVFEGGDGCGKSTQARLLAERLEAVLTHEPGATELGESIRELLLHSEVEPSPVTEALLFAADRAQHVTEVLEPTLAAGRDVVCDRFVPSSIAYQAHGRGVEVQLVETLARIATGGLEADLVVLLEVDDEQVAARGESAPDNIERRDHQFRSRVRSAFRAMAEQSPELWAVVDGSGTVEEVAAAVSAVVEQRLGGPTRS